METSTNAGRYDRASELNASGLQTKTAEISTTGAADAEIAVAETLKVAITGAGKVSYSGNPTTIEKHITGAGLDSTQGLVCAKSRRNTAILAVRRTRLLPAETAAGWKPCLTKQARCLCYDHDGKFYLRAMRNAVWRDCQAAAALHNLRRRTAIRSLRRSANGQLSTAWRPIITTVSKMKRHSLSASAPSRSSPLASAHCSCNHAAEISFGIVFRCWMKKLSPK
jgi:hypothetical protein